MIIFNKKFLCENWQTNWSLQLEMVFHMKCRFWLAAWFSICRHFDQNQHFSTFYSFIYLFM